MKTNTTTYILTGSSPSKLGVLDLIIGCLYQNECYAYEIVSGDWSSDVCSSDLCLLANTITACCRSHSLPEPHGLTA